MAPSQQETWDRWKNAIHTLYIVQGRALKGPEGVVELMRARHGFIASDTEYERYLTRWGFKKKTTKETWKIIGWKIDKRHRVWKKPTNVYRDGVLIPSRRLDKEVSRQGFMTTFERLQIAQGQSPRTPAGFEIRTPATDSIVRLEFEGLPMLKYQEAISLLSRHLAPRPQNTSELVQLIGNTSLGSPVIKDCSEPMTALLPVTALSEVGPGFELLPSETVPSGPTQFLNLMTYAINNNILGETQIYEFYQWLKTQQVVDTISRAISGPFPIFEGPTGEALREHLFQLAVQESDVDMVKHLLSAGADPNASLCTLWNCPLSFTPLQYSCLLGHIPIVCALLRAEASMEDNLAGWQGSILILAMLRCSVDHPDPWNKTIHFSKFLEAAKDKMSQNFRVRSASRLIELLISSGAKVNAVSPVRGRREDPESSELVYDGGDLLFRSLVVESHSPLTFASRFCFTSIVAVLIQAGADVNHFANDINSALRECLCPKRYECPNGTKYYVDGIYHYQHWSPLEHGEAPHFDIIGTVKKLLSMGVNPDDHWVCKGNEVHDEYMCHSVLDLAMSIRTRDTLREIFDLLIAHGAHASTHTLRLATQRGDYHVFRQVLRILPFSPRVAAATWAYDDQKKSSFFGLCIGDLVSQKIHERKMVNALVAACFAIGTVSEFECLLQSIRLPEPLSPSLYLDLDARGCFAKMEHFELKFRLLKANNLLHGASPDLLGILLSLALQCGTYPSADELIESGASVDTPVNGRPPILQAVMNADWALVKKLLLLGARLKVPPHHTYQCGHLDNLLVRVIHIGGDDKIIDELLATPGVDINGIGMPDCWHTAWVGNPACCSPLAIAIKVRNWPLVCRLRLAGANVNSTCGDLEMRAHISPLAAAVQEGSTPELVLSLIEDGADLDDYAAWAPAMRDKHMTTLLISQMGRLDDLQRSRLSSFALCEAIELNHDEVACQNGNKAIVDLLIEYGADVNAPPAERYGATALQFAAIGGYLGIAHTLVQKGADVNAPPAPHEGRTALEGAAEHGRNDMLQFLMNSGADISGPDFDLKTMIFQFLNRNVYMVASERRS
ncbi:uncharacterized protein DNG_09903 [Cephalotrichum gorgonifer]|uniref:Clr5 domain-containing protein n=1 Tax=Cephalotrichum gorgonifer TaxID=2041049 RepID=A0AAE8N7M8_9PEZI|nr:uncharacterized protein DNG_09903 [Cephalotrichum gorgonifer]